MEKATVKMKEVKGLINHAIDRNIELQKAGKKPHAISFEGEAGIGKTSIVRQVAKEREMTFVKLNLAMIDEAGD